MGTTVVSLKSRSIVDGLADLLRIPIKTIQVSYIIISGMT